MSTLLKIVIVSLLPSTIFANTWGKPMRFRVDGTFKLTEVSDTHYTQNLFCKDISPEQEKYPCSDANGTNFFKSVVELEEPDVFVFTGDNVCGGDIFGGKAALDGLLADFIKQNEPLVPWLAVEGNHDGESGINYQEVAEYLLTLPNGLNEMNCDPLTWSSCFGNTNFLLPVYGPENTKDANASLFNIWNIDSNSYSTDPKIGGYGWIHQNQIDWYSNYSANLSYIAKSQGRPQANAIAFQHIPLPQHQTIITDKIPIIGQYHEPVSCPEIDTGLAAQFKKSSDVKALTVGHDHTNDYSGELNGTFFLYDGHGNYGASGYGEPDWPIRSRVWLISAFGHTIQTYKRLDTLAGGIPVPNPTIDVQEIFSDVPLSSIALSLTSGSPLCDYTLGFFADHYDINFGMGGKYSYLCYQRATATTTHFVVNVTAVMITETLTSCPGLVTEGWHFVTGNIHEGVTNMKNISFCYQTASSGDRILVDIAVAQGRHGQQAQCLSSYEALTFDLSLSNSNGEMTILCGRYEQWTKDVIARAEYSATEEVKRRLPNTFMFSTLLDENKKDVAADRMKGKRARVSV